ncbi:RNA polymerase sigma-70 factor (ECF subfamily) [Chitinophaga dinghuensis]|uniref:RNA polymerase sigma-70 factor (ECF subfamily) n=1 Tax=Chitinophaga dinghuensis TaxID=1539050 RepID=A0A327VW02_9BACT|nr:sigma-70 family RNA polymerase sigma factor [Chitinophaga dinghuensis]RAJ80181.1 RNA polymerase sigma-70 factor (ECF subfamily) [Chitinophaga dinghuensis]
MVNQFKLSRKSSYNHLPELLQCNRENAIKDLYQAYYKHLLREANYIVRDKDLAEDVVQNVFITIWNKRMDLPVPVNLKAYLIVCVRRRAIDELKKANKLEKNKQLYDNDRSEAITQRRMEDKEIYVQILKAMKAVPPHQRKIFEMRFIHELSTREIMETKGLSNQTIKNHMSSSIKIIRNRLKAHYIQ